MHIRSPWDSIEAKLDVPSTLSLQFFIRDDELHLVAHMRSSDLILGIAYDVPAFTLLQELMAFELGVKVGSYTHVSNSLHIYERHYDMVENMLKKEAVQRSLQLHRDIGPMPPLPTTPPTEGLFALEADIRTAASVDELDELITNSPLFLGNDNSYWVDWAIVLAAHRAGKLKDKPAKVRMLDSTSFKGYHTI